jgi:hypothetical protein
VIACRKSQRCLTFAAKLPEFEIFQVNIERLHESDEQAGQALAITTAEEKNFMNRAFGLRSRSTRACH